MRASLGATVAVLGALGAIAAGSVTAYASPAAASADTFTVVSAAATPGNPDQVTVVVDSPSTFASLTAQFWLNGADAYEQTLALQSSATDPTDSTQTQTTWTANIPMGTAGTGLPLGSYAIAVSATWADSGTPYAITNAGQFSFEPSSSVTLLAANTKLSYPNTDAPLSGAVTLTYPDGTTDTDYSGVSVEILANGAEAADEAVASDGTYSIPDFTATASETIVAEVTGSGVESSSSGSVALTVTSTTPTLKLTVNPVTETYGKTATVSGTLTYTSGSTSEPIANQEVWLANQEWGSNSAVGAVMTGTGGTFTIPVPAEQKATTLYVGTLSNVLPDVNAVEAPLQVDVVNPTVISDFKVSLGQYWNLSLSGCLGFTSGNKAQTFEHTTGLTVQYETAPNAWKNLFAISGTEKDTRCGTGGIDFTGSHAAPDNYAYYRVVYAGTKGATSYAAAASSAALAWRYADRITGFGVSPSVVNAGGKLTIKGTLQYYYGGWRNYGGQIIWINLRPKGSSTWYWMVKVKTNSKGQFSATFKDPVSATWDAGFDGNNTGVGHLAATSSEVYVRLK